MKVVNATRNTTISENTTIAKTLSSRTKGLLGRDFLDKGSALILDPCNNIHTLFMRFNIDVIFLNRNNIVVGLVKNIKPFRISPIFFSAKLAIELPSNTIQSTQTRIKDLIKFI